MKRIDLSDTKDTVFDNSKVGKTVSGKYLITRGPKDSDTFIMEVVFMSKEKMGLKSLVEGWTPSGNTVTYYTSPIRE